MALSNHYEWLVGTRYLRSGNRRGFLSFITVISVLGLALGVMVLVVVMSVMNGFEQELRSRILGVTSHAMLLGEGDTLPEWRRVDAQVQGMPGVLAAAPYIEAGGMAAVAGTGRLAEIPFLRGVDPAREEKMGGLARMLTAGSLGELAPGAWRVVLGEELAAELGVRVGDTVRLAVPKGTFTPAGVQVRQRNFTVAGVFSSGMYEYDRGLALLHVADAAVLLRFGDAMTGVRLALADPLAAPRTVHDLAVALGVNSVSDWTRVHPNFFRSIQMTKSLLFMILSMIVAIAAFNIVATLVMVVKDKEADIAILRTFGAAPRNILRVFGVQGAWIGITGVGLGLALGALLATNLESLVHLLERATGMKFLDAKVYFMSDLPARVQLGDVVQVALVALLLCLLAALYPAWRASRVLPAEALRHD